MEKAEFKNYRMLLLEVQQLRTQVAVLESSLYSPKGQKFTSTPRSSSSFGSTMDAAVARHMKLYDLYCAQLAEKEAEQFGIEQAIESLGNTPERLVMRARYIEGKGWPTISREMQSKGYSERTVYRLHGEALLKLREA